MNNFWNDRVLAGLTVLLAITGLITLGWVVYKSMFTSRNVLRMGNTSCISQTLTRKMEDDNLAGIVSKGEVIQILKDYYKCNPVKRGDLVYFRFSDAIDPVAKVVQGLPGDLFEVQQDKEDKLKYFVKINNNYVETKGGRYYFKASHVPPLKTYEISRKGVLGGDEYIIFSNVPPGISDSSNFGIVRLNAFEARVLPVQE